MMPRREINKNIVIEMASHIQMLHDTSDQILENVNDVNMLYDALYDLDEIIGMDNIKDSIIKLIKFLLVNGTPAKTNKFDDHMMHTVIYGSPGVGKTMVGSVLAKIWSALGLVKKVKLEEKPKSRLAERIYPLLAKNRSAVSDDEADPKKSIVPIMSTTHLNRFKKTTEQSVQTTEEEQDKTDKTDKPNIEEMAERFIRLYTMLKLLDEKLKETNELNKKNNTDVPSPTLPTLPNLPSLPMLSAPPVLSALPVPQDTITTTTTTQQEIKKDPLKRLKMNSPIKIVSRNDFVGQYLGQTADKTHKLLVNTLNEGKALFIDEAYSLINDERDSYGHEALNELNKFMSEHPELIIIFAGYKDKLESTLFTYQPGFKRRCTWVFSIDKYTPEMLSKIFIKQLGKDFWTFDGDGSQMHILDDFFKTHFDQFQAFGGDTLKLGLYCKLAYSEMRFDERIKTMHHKTIYKTITKEMLEIALKEFMKNNIEDEDKGKQIYATMYV